jgi:ATP-dependent protease ClpP protease subunit
MSVPEMPEIQPEFVNVEGNEIFFYCEVCEESIAELIRAVKKLSVDMRVSLVKMGLHKQIPEVTIHIRSDGGDLYAGLAALDYLQNTDAHVTTVAEGCVASAATFIFLGGDVRLVRPHAYMLIHQLGSDMWGKYEELKDEMRQNDRIMRDMKKIYLRETNLPEHKLAKMLKRDVYLSYRKCVKYGVVSHP